MSDESQPTPRPPRHPTHLFDHPATAVELPSKSGQFRGALRPRAAHGRARPLAMSPSTPASESNRTPPDSARYNVSWGFVEVLGDRVTISPPTPSSPKKSTCPAPQQQLDRGHKMWNEAGESEDAYTDALRVISEAEAKIASASEKH